MLPPIPLPRVFPFALAQFKKCGAMEVKPVADRTSGSIIMSPTRAWIKLSDRKPNPDQHSRVLIYTEGFSFNGKQVFDVEVVALNKCISICADDPLEIYRRATHWTTHPCDSGMRSDLRTTEDRTDILGLMLDVWQFSLWRPHMY